MHVCVFIHVQNNYMQYTHTYLWKQKLSFWMQLNISQH